MHACVRPVLWLFLSIFSRLRRASTSKILDHIAFEFATNLYHSNFGSMFFLPASGCITVSLAFFFAPSMCLFYRDITSISLLKAFVNIKYIERNPIIYENIMILFYFMYQKYLLMKFNREFECNLTNFDINFYYRFYEYIFMGILFAFWHLF